jgi:GNAT superfamily N-acetyltransferase
MTPSVRHARRGDGAALAAMHEELGAYYAELAPRHFVRPDVTGLAAELDAELEERSDELVLVAEAHGHVVGALWARIVAPSSDAARQVERDLALIRLRIDYLVTAARHRRRGIAALLVHAAEAWGREHGAAVAEASTYRPSPLAFPFWTEAMGYEERSVEVRKPLA